jgi:hypothetical protein
MGYWDGSEDMTARAVASALGKRFMNVSLSENKLTFLFEDGTVLQLTDNAQSCCEKRWMSCDDELPKFDYDVLLDMEVRDASKVDHDDYDVHDEQFLIVTTSSGVFTVVDHNEHNGYYGGFDLSVVVPQAPAELPKEPATLAKVQDVFKKLYAGKA